MRASNLLKSSLSGSVGVLISYLLFDKMSCGQSFFSLYNFAATY